MTQTTRQVTGMQCSPAQAWWAVVVLGTAYLLSFVDRTIINLLVGPIEQDLQINDTQFGALQGLAFGLFYSLAALPLGRLADSRNRRAIISAGLAFFYPVFNVIGAGQNLYCAVPGTYGCRCG